MKVYLIVLLLIAPSLGRPGLPTPDNERGEVNETVTQSAPLQTSVLNETTKPVEVPIIKDDLSIIDLTRTEVNLNRVENRSIAYQDDDDLTNYRYDEDHEIKYIPINLKIGPNNEAQTTPTEPSTTHQTTQVTVQNWDKAVTEKSKIQKITSKWTDQSDEIYAFNNLNVTPSPVSLSFNSYTVQSETDQKIKKRRKTTTKPTTESAVYYIENQPIKTMFEQNQNVMPPSFSLGMLPPIDVQLSTPASYLENVQQHEPIETYAVNEVPTPIPNSLVMFTTESIIYRPNNVVVTKRPYRLKPNRPPPSSIFNIQQFSPSLPSPIKNTGPVSYYSEAPEQVFADPADPDPVDNGYYGGQGSIKNRPLQDDALTFERCPTVKVTLNNENQVTSKESVCGDVEITINNPVKQSAAKPLSAANDDSGVSIVDDFDGQDDDIIEPGDTFADPESVIIESDPNAVATLSDGIPESLSSAGGPGSLSAASPLAADPGGSIVGSGGTGGGAPADWSGLPQLPGLPGNNHHNHHRPHKPEGSDDFGLTSYFGLAGLVGMLMKGFAFLAVFNPFNFGLWSILFSPLAAMVVGGAALTMYLFPWTTPAVIFARKTAPTIVVHKHSPHEWINKKPWDWEWRRVEHEVERQDNSNTYKTYYYDPVARTHQNLPYYRHKLDDIIHNYQNKWT